jgi:soluble lytic murein transglycosylase-like protein
MSHPPPLHHCHSAASAVLGVLLAGLVASPAAAQVFVGPAGPGGATVISNFQSDEAPMLLLAGVETPQLPAALAAAHTAAQPARGPTQPGVGLGQQIRQAAERHGLSEPLLLAVIAAESRFNPRAVSPKGASGLMQLMPATARRFGASDLFAVDQNLQAGAAYLRWLLDLFSGDVELALAGYNAGEGAVLRAGRRVPNFPETRHYVPRVLAYQAHYASRR